MESRNFHQKRVSGHFPQCGAIFMADNSTRKECFQRKIFGLPSNFANFVMKIKTGMLLFLFDHQDKKLYGVFKAISDGAMNIVPHAYKSSGKQFPAQVCFSIKWRCVPVPEETFRDAIGENYFAPYKFNFGLSRIQVNRLLNLFEVRRIETPVAGNLSWKRKWHIGFDETNSEVESKSISDSYSDSLSGAPAISNNGNAKDFDGNQPLLSIDGKEIEKPLPDELAGDDFIPLPAIDLEETEDPLPDGLVEGPLKLLANQQEYDALQLAIESLFSEVGLIPLQKEPGPQDENTGEGNKQIGDELPHCVNGLYSDSTKERTSVFLRLSGSTKVLQQDQVHVHDKIDNSRKIFERIEKNQKTWKQLRTPYHDPKTWKSRKSVFSRLRYTAGQVEERELTGSTAAYENKCMAIPEGLLETKRKNHMRETHCGVEGSIAMKEELSETNKRIRTGKSSWEAKDSDISSTGGSSVGLDLLSGISANTVNCGSCDATCKSQGDKGSSEFASEELKVCGQSGPTESCRERAKQTMTKEVQPCPIVTSKVLVFSESLYRYACYRNRPKSLCGC